ncbi:AraC family transcriptional regulator [Sphingobacterium sp. BIGb0165]|uniref:helix-turn-helix domain-containing protein n=1 Tax=Sphingobacterium sp. BIGb0165 TaxID=2940615 RepID=UPI00216740EA|nr:helix-turn-helix domain-containing protein [Sphingobacterium sp. BIGb0165]MCS4226151.1 AraC-like DNA-binding protein [Sphingobacterium sp. BIGb0165]
MMIEGRYLGSKKEEETILAFKTLIEQHLKKQKRLDFYLSELNISKWELERMFADVLGLSPTKFLRNFIVEHITKDLTTTEMPMKALCAQYGFTSASTLTRFVKSTTGMTPSKYRALKYKE